MPAYTDPTRRFSAGHRGLAPIRSQWLVLLVAISVRGSAEETPLVRTQRGDLPIILSAPHGGQLDVPGATPRTGDGLERKPGGFVTARDTGTEELAQQVADAIANRCGARPYFVICRAHRKFLDPNREPHLAYEGDATRAVYERYHATLEDYAREVRKRFRAGLVLDLHGQGSASDTVFRGTQNGSTVSLLRDRFGETAHTGEASLVGQLKAGGWKVFPDPFDGREQAGFTGGYIVRHYGGQGGFGLDAIQLEFGGDYRTAKARPATAKVLAAATADYATRYLAWKPPAPADDVRRPKD